MSVHAEYAPSGMKRKALCPASHRAEKAYPDRSGPAAIDGTHTHTGVEHCLVNETWDASVLIGGRLSDHEGSFAIDKARTDRIQMALDFVKLYVDMGYNLYAESSVNPGQLIFRSDWYGTADIILVSPDKLHLIVADYKDGSMPVSPFKNPQGISYLLGGLLETSITDPAAVCEFVIIQPKAMGVTTWQVSSGLLLQEYLPQMVKVIDACEAEDPEFVPGDEQCQFCKHKTDCEPRRLAAIETANLALSKIELPGGTTQALPPSLPAISQMSDEQIGHVKDMAAIVKGWLKDVDAEADERVAKGGVIPGWKQVQKDGRRSWIDDTPVIFKTLTSMTHEKERIWKKKDLVEEKPISFTAVLGNPKLSRTQKEKIQKTLIKTPSGKKTLVPVTDKGKDISPAAMLSGIPDLTLEAPQLSTTEQS